jgi:beta-phosphoglucomutase-like phosphatase (HAD superfamily)
MTPDPALDAVVRQARHLLFAFDGPIRGVMRGKSEDPAAVDAPPAPHIQEALAACRESGRSATIISASPSAEVWAYLDAHDLSIPIPVVASLISEAITALEASPTECAVITISPSDIQAAQVAGAPSIGYAKTHDDAVRLKASGAGTVVTSMANLALVLRARFTA